MCCRSNAAASARRVGSPDHGACTRSISFCCLEIHLLVYACHSSGCPGSGQRIIPRSTNSTPLRHVDHYRHSRMWPGSLSELESNRHAWPSKPWQQDAAPVGSAAWRGALARPAMVPQRCSRHRHQALSPMTYVPPCALSRAVDDYTSSCPRCASWRIFSTWLLLSRIPLLTLICPSSLKAIHPPSTTV